MAGNGRDPYGLEQYRGAMEAVQENFPGLFPTLREAYERMKTEDQVPETAVLTEMPREEDVVKEIMEKYDLVPRRIQSRRTVGLQVGVESVNKETQTERPQPRTVIIREYLPQTNPFLAMLEAQTPLSTPTDPLNFPCSATVAEPRIIQDPRQDAHRGTKSERKSSRETPTQEFRYERSRDIPKPAPKNPRGCWNCGGDHRYNKCAKVLKLFCFRCGEPGYTSDKCPYCN